MSQNKNREIKFRAWDILEACMVDFKSTKIGIEYCFDDFIVSSGYNSRKEPTYKEDTRGRFIIMQYTGLKDKNGVEIYEGDIIRNEHGVQGSVEFEKMIHIGRELRLTGKPLNVEVIGNIHQNEELLK